MKSFRCFTAWARTRAPSLLIFATAAQFGPAMSRNSVGLSLDAQVAGLAAGKRVYLFSPHPWTADSVRDAVEQVAR